MNREWQTDRDIDCDTARSFDCVVVGASFAGLACATTMAQAGMNVMVLEKKHDAGAKLHTTGIIVKDAVDEIALLDGLPSQLTRQVHGVRLYAPNMTYVDLEAPGYYFLATDTPNVMRWLAARAQRAGVTIKYRSTFHNARRIRGGFDLGEHGCARYLVGADGPRSRVANALQLGVNSDFLAGVEYEYPLSAMPAADKLHCFIDKEIAPGYIAWIVSGVEHVQVGVAIRRRGVGWQPEQAMAALLEKISSIVDFRNVQPRSIRAGLIPCGGLVSPVASPRALLVGDAAGMVSPVTAGGIHTALKHGMAAGNAIADYLTGKRTDPCEWFVNSYPQFAVKRALRFAFDHFQSDLAFNLLLATKPMRMAASYIYFHRKGVF